MMNGYEIFVINVCTHFYSEKKRNGKITSELEIEDLSLFCPTGQSAPYQPKQRSNSKLTDNLCDYKNPKPMVDTKYHDPVVALKSILTKNQWVTLSYLLTRRILQPIET